MGVFVAISFALLLVACSAEYIPEEPPTKCPDGLAIIKPCFCATKTPLGLVIECENSNLASTSIAVNNLATLPHLIKSLSISKHKIEKLYGAIFFKSKIQILRFEDTPIRAIDDVTFNGINETLRELHLQNADLEEFPATALQPLGNLTVLNIDGHKMRTLDKNIVPDSLLPTRLEKFFLVNGALDDIPIETFQPFRRLKTLDLSNNSISALKRNQFKNLREVEILDISHNEIAKLESQQIADLVKLGWLNASHNAIADLPRGLFARNAVLKVLNLSFNKLKKLDSNTFRGMRFLRRLYLSDNQISEIGRGAFSSIARIGTIDLARNLLTKIDYQMFAQLNYIEIIDVSQNAITEIQKQSFKDVYQALVNISHNQVETIENNAFENCVNITVLDLSHNALTTFQRNVFDLTTYATELQLSFNYLTDMSAIPLQNMTGLKWLNVSHNQITTIPKNTFPKLYEVEKIDASYNNISFIANDVFKPLLSLRLLDLSHNAMDEIKSQAFGTLHTLFQLDLSHNRIRQIARGALAKLTSLRFLQINDNLLEGLFQIPISLSSLSLSNNALQEVPAGTWPTMNSLLQLDLSGNQLGDSLQPDSFAGLLTVQRINLNSNGITVPPRSLGVLSTLQYVYLENNNITELEEAAFGKLPTVFEINLSGNQIEKISNKAFEGLLQLLNVNLSSNAIAAIPMDAFVGLVSLQTMDLSHNSLERLHNKTNSVLDLCYSLKALNLSHNRISSLTRTTFPSNPYVPYLLSDIDLSYNKLPVLTRDITYGTKKVKKLNLANNFIADIKPYVLANLTALEDLDLSGNGLTDLTYEEHNFTLPTTLKTLNLEKNNIFRLNDSSFEPLTDLKTLNLRFNSLQTFAPIFTAKIKNETNVLFEGNPFNCNCHARPLKYYLQSLSSHLPEFERVKCEAPATIAGKTLYEVSKGALQCVAEDIKYPEQTDLTFQEIFIARGHLIVKWYLTSNEDIADFYVCIRNSQNAILFEDTLPYSQRYAQLKGEQLTDAITQYGSAQVCILAKTSRGTIGNWFDEQCLDFSSRFVNIIQDHHASSSKIFIILSQKERRLHLLQGGFASGSGGIRANFFMVYLLPFLFIFHF